MNHATESKGKPVLTADPFQPTLQTLQACAKQVYQHLQPSAQLAWPLLDARCGRAVLVKHENHNPTGAFKVRGGLVYLQNLVQRQPHITSVVTATRGNHGQSIAYAASKLDLHPIIVVPEGNNPDKNRAMAALGAEVIVHGRDFDEAVPHALSLAGDPACHAIPSFHSDLVMGVASYSLELLQAAPDLARVYVPIGLGSGICGMICARNALGMDTEIVGVVAASANCYALSLAAGRCVSTESALTCADGVAVRNPSPDALAIMSGNVARVIEVDDQAVMRATAALFNDTHNAAEGAGAIALAALLQDPQPAPDGPSAIVLSGGNTSATDYARILSRYGEPA